MAVLFVVHLFSESFPTRFHDALGHYIMAFVCGPSLLIYMLALPLPKQRRVICLRCSWYRDFPFRWGPFEAASVKPKRENTMIISSRYEEDYSMAKRKQSQLPELVRHDGDLCATFVNTASGKRQPIRSYADLLVWGQRNGALTPSDAQRLGRAATEHPSDAERVFARARELRDLLERVLLALAARRAPAVDDLEALSDALGAALSNRRLAPADGGGWRVDWGERGGDDLDRMLWPVVTSAVDVLTSRFRHKVYLCANDDCRLILVDRDPGRPRTRCRRCARRHRSSKHYRTKVKPRWDALKRRPTPMQLEDARRRRKERQRERDTETESVNREVF